MIACVDYSRRRKIVPNHTFTHILNFALRGVLGEQVCQKVRSLESLWRQSFVF